jgi:hypothetical protein
VPSVSDTVRRFPILFTGANRAMAIVGITRSSSYLEVTAATVEVRMGWAFHATLSRSAIQTVHLDHERIWARGVHWWAGVWMVNGSGRGLVRIECDPPGRGRSIGWPVHPRVLRVSVEDPEGLVLALQPA